MEPFLIFIGIVTYLWVGLALYRLRWPNGLFPPRLDPERERLLRVSRKRVLPAPNNRADQ